VAALLASRGFATFALAYFDVEGLPSGLYEIPLKYFGKALQLARSSSLVGEAAAAWDSVMARLTAAAIFAIVPITMIAIRNPI
jgi:hypothetical protein